MLLLLLPFALVFCACPFLLGHIAHSEIQLRREPPDIRSSTRSIFQNRQKTHQDMSTNDAPNPECWQILKTQHKCQVRSEHHFCESSRRSRKSASMFPLEVLQDTRTQRLPQEGTTCARLRNAKALRSRKLPPDRPTRSPRWSLSVLL